MFLPSHPEETSELGTTACSVGIGLSPPKSKLARQPSKPVRDKTELGSPEYISFCTPPTYSSPSKSKLILDPRIYKMY